MSSLLEPGSLTTLGALTRLLVRHGRAGLFDGVDAEVPGGSARPEELAADLEALGPTWVKLGQLLSTRPDLIPPVYATALARLQERVEPFSGEVARRIVEEEIGVGVDKAFAEFSETPLAAGSLAQVHPARMHDGREVVVKVRRPDAEEAIERDLGVLEQLADLLEDRTDTGRRIGARRLFEEMRDSLHQELDFRAEARSLRAIGAALEDRERVSAPGLVADYSGRRVLTMERVPGTTVASLGPLARMERDPVPALEDLIRGYLDMALVDGLVHADPHPGNLILTPDDRLFLVDAGMTVTVPEHNRDLLLRLLVAMAEGNGSEAARLMEDLCLRSDDYEPEEFEAQAARLVTRHHVEGAEQGALGRLVLELTRLAVDQGLKVPREATKFGKTLLNLDETARLLDPEFRPDRVVREATMEMVRERGIESLSPSQLLKGALETREFVMELPKRLGDALDRFGRDRFEIRMHLPEDSPVMKAAQKMANRITAGLVIASLVVGSALLMSVPTDFEILGYPGLAMVFFLAAALVGAALVWRIWKDV